MARGRARVPRITYACKQCGASKELTASQLRCTPNRGSFCSRRCHALWKQAHGKMNGTRIWQNDPDLAEFITLLYPDHSNKDIAAAVGVKHKAINSFGHWRELRKDDEWMRANGHAILCPQDPELRKLFKLQQAIKQTIAKRSKELT